MANHSTNKHYYFPMTTLGAKYVGGLRVHFASFRLMVLKEEKQQMHSTSLAPSD